MKYSLLLTVTAATLLVAAEKAPVHVMDMGTAPVGQTTTIVCEHPTPACDCPKVSAVKETKEQEPTLTPAKDMRISVVGQGVAPSSTTSPAQAYALAKRAAITDAYRMIAEKVKGVRVEGQDVIKDMMVKRSTVRTHVDAMVRQANIIETTFKEGLCEVEMEIVLSHSQFAR